MGKVQDVRRELQTGNTNFVEIAQKTGAKESTVRTQWYLHKREMK